MSTSSLIGVTLGDPAGIGPELVAHALAHPPSGIAPEQLVVFGDREVLARAAERGGGPLAQGGYELVEVTRLEGLVPGRPNEDSGRAQVAYLEAAVARVRSDRRVTALVTAPIHKAASQGVGFAFPGHTEFFAERLGAPGHPCAVTMLLAGPRLRVSLATIHLGVAEVPSRLTIDGIAQAIVHTTAALRHDFGLERPRVAVAALNPHAGESGRFGDEEARLIVPAIAEARRRLGHEFECDLTGPHVPDLVFRQATIDATINARYDAVVAMYHDQGLIPAKLLDFAETVNVTLGLPIVRTSPDHGVAYDLAGTGRANPASFLSALRLAASLARRRFESI